MKDNNDRFVDYICHVTDSDWIIALDPGHGGMINGQYMTAPDKMCDHGDYVFYEGVFNRIITKKLASFLRKEGISHYFTTNSNYDKSLGERVHRANRFMKAYPEKKHLYLSLHGNAAPPGAESAAGIEVFTSKGKTSSDPLAEIIFDHLSKMGWIMRKDTSDGDSDKEANFYVLRKTGMSAVLVELGFFTNESEAWLMMDDIIQDCLAELLANAVREITNTN